MLPFVVLLFFFFFFKRKTAYEMRISDWSSDVCSSDLLGVIIVGRFGRDLGQHRLQSFDLGRTAFFGKPLTDPVERVSKPLGFDGLDEIVDGLRLECARSEERRVGKEWVSTCRSRGAQLHEKKKQQTKARHTNRK